MDAQAPGELNVQTAALVPDEELWFPDGNVVLEAQGHAFRVYQGLLGYNSEVFRDLFTVPQPPSAETFDGCPMVHLTDHPEELRHLLRVIFDGKKYYPHHVRLDFSVVAALIRLSHKYQIQYVREDYLSRTKSCFCTDADQWNEAYIKCGSSSMAYVNTDAIQAVNIARLTDTVSILPSALLVCCHLDANSLLNGSRRLDDTLERLSKQDIASCICVAVLSKRPWNSYSPLASHTQKNVKRKTVVGTASSNCAQFSWKCTQQGVCSQRPSSPAQL
ncbi:hypothetical protein EVJ58_g1969 [Rhodofomes roseus]|uniref:BTB domain-containing protein n=1 Tax=Rhodofomes roseus TaxID=34475 RepID=A0A4Y9YTE1_9APHY|nr:hypothetical protein EVJ58_g1969 [Rhodofomes roseus]